MAAGTIAILIGYVVANAMNLAFQLLLTHRLSTADVGRFFEMTALIGVAVGLIVGGLRPAVLRYVAIEPEDSGNWIARRLISRNMAMAILAAGALAVVAPYLARTAFSDPGLASALQLGAVAVPLMCTATLWASVARARGSFWLYVLIDQASLPLTRFFVGLAMLVMGFGLTGAVSAQVIAAGVSAAVGLGLAAAWGIVPARHPLRSVRNRMKEVIRFASFRWGIDLLQVILLWADTLMLGALKGASSAGVYGVVGRVVVFSSVGLTAVNLMLAPLTARQLAAHDRSEASRWYGLGARWGTILTFLPLGLITVLRVQALEVFGSQFERGAAALAILAIGFAFNAAAGPAGVLLNMSALGPILLVDNILTVALNISLNAVLIPTWGIQGAALAWTLSLVLINVLMVYQVRTRLGARVLQHGQLVTVASLTAVTTLAWVIGSIVSVIAGVGVVLLGFTVAVIFTRTEDEGKAWRHVVHRLRGSRS
jgi:O-antigen/teichoic acid export membrane protein